MKRTLSFLVVLLLLPQASLAHPGNTASDGCHYCWTNCSEWDEVYGERHCHEKKFTSAHLIETQYTEANYRNFLNILISLELEAFCPHATVFSITEQDHVFNSLTLYDNYRITLDKVYGGKCDQDAGCSFRKSDSEEASKVLVKYLVLILRNTDDNCGTNFNEGLDERLVKWANEQHSKRNVSSASSSYASSESNFSLHQNSIVGEGMYDRVCSRVTKRFALDATMWKRVNDRVQKRFGFVCRKD